MNVQEKLRHGSQTIAAEVEILSQDLDIGMIVSVLLGVAAKAAWRGGMPAHQFAGMVIQLLDECVDDGPEDER